MSRSASQNTIGWRAISEGRVIRAELDMKTVDSASTSGSGVGFISLPDAGSREAEGGSDCAPVISLTTPWKWCRFIHSSDRR